ncbi:MAG: hypothetical protein ISN29_11880 [Gammaproteobacteria bacterium AqS3]|nr:hypothetical protein [Gammaproteobacteria bacterium AqS3]
MIPLPKSRPGRRRVADIEFSQTATPQTMNLGSISIDSEDSIAISPEEAQNEEFSKN